MFITEKMLQKSVRFCVLDVGEGLMVLLVLPDETTIMYDCNVRNAKENEIIEQLKKYIPNRQKQQYIDVFINSHRDADHIHGLQKIHHEFPICKIWDSGQTGNNTGTSDYQYYMRLRRELGCCVPTPSTHPIASYGKVKIYCLSSSTHNVSTFTEALKIQHTNSIVLSVRYGDASILLTGDSDWYAWKNYIVPQFQATGLLKSSVLVASHHGSRSFFTDESNDQIDEERNSNTTYLDALKYIRPKVTLISCGAVSQYHHPNEDALKLYADYTENGQVWTTYKCESFFGGLYHSGQLEFYET